MGRACAPLIHKLASMPEEFFGNRSLFRSRVFLFGLLPIGYSHLTLLELTPRDGFVEESPMTSMHLWRHERRIHDDSVGGTVTVVDRLTFEPKHARRVIAWFIGKVFEHRHRVLRANFAVAKAEADGTSQAGGASLRGTRRP